MHSSVLAGVLAFGGIFVASGSVVVAETPFQGNYFELPPNQVAKAEIGVLGLVREAPDSQLLAVNQDYDPLLDANELQGSMQFGLRFQLDILQVSNHFGGVDLQTGYFGVNSLDAETTLYTEDYVITQFFNSLPANPEDTSNIHYSTNLYSSEINFLFNARANLRPLVGVRFLKTEDTFDIFQHGSGGVSRLGFFSTTNNTMFGGQAGLELDIPCSPFFKIYSLGKYGFMGNDVEGAAKAVDASTGNDVVKNFGDETYCSLIEAGVGFEYAFAGPLSFRAGYHFLFVSDVATGTEQSRAVNLLSPGEPVVFDSQQFHGINLTTMWRY